MVRCIHARNSSRGEVRSPLLAALYTVVSITMISFIGVTDVLADITGQALRDINVSGVDVGALESGISASVRVEFTFPADGSRDCLEFSASGLPTVQFAANGATVDSGLHSPRQYCQSNPKRSANCYVNGDPLVGGGSADDAANFDVLITFPHPATDNTDGLKPPAKLAVGSQMGSIWGLACQRSTDTLFASTFVKPQVGFGPAGLLVFTNSESVPVQQRPAPLLP